MLTGPEIIRQRELGNITIEPFNPQIIGSNSYDLTLGPKLMGYCTVQELDMKRNNMTWELEIPEEGYVLQPGELYLGVTNEVAGSNAFVPCVSGRSSTGRLGIFVHITAGFGDVGFVNRWTLEITCVKPVRIYKNVRICQIYFEETVGTYKQYEGRYHSKYNGPRADLPTASRMHLDMPRG